MSKKSLISTLIISLVVTLALGIYTIVSVFGGSNPLTPRNDVVRLAYLVDDEVTVFKDYNKDNIAFKIPDGGAMPIEETETAGIYKAKKAGEVSAVVTLDRVGHTDKYNTITYNIFVYNQGTGTSDDPWIVPNANHFAKLRDSFNESLTATAPEYVKLAGDIDLGNENWEPIGWEGHPYNGNIDGNGFKILNLKISVTKADLLAEDSRFTHESEGKAYVDLGLFGAIENNTISNLGFGRTDGTGAAQINVSADALEALTGTYETTYTAFAKLNIGVVAGYAKNVDIVGVTAEGEEKTAIASTITGYSYGQTTTVSNGIGGVVGSGALVRISGLSVTSVVVNNQPTYAKGTRIGGVVGDLTNTYNLDNIEVTKELKNKIENVDVSFTASLLYSLESTVGGVVGRGYCADIVNTNVTRFNISDTTQKKNVDYTLEKATLAGGVAGRLLTSIDSTGTRTADFVSSISNVTVENIDAYMLGGQVAGVVGVLGSTSNEADTSSVKDVTVKGVIQADDASGVAYQINPHTSVEYTKAFDAPVIDVTLKGHRNGGVAIANYGKIAGFVAQNEPAEGETLVETKTAIKVAFEGMGADPTDGTTAEALYILRTTSISAGVAVYNDPGYDRDEKFDVVPEISNLEVEVEGRASFVANDVVGSVNYAGVAYQVKNAKVTGVDVKSAKFTSAYGKFSNGQMFSSTYMIAGLVNIAGEGADIENNSVASLLVNSDADKTLKLGAAYVGGLISRYIGDEGGVGMTLKNNSVLAGEMYFNYNSFYAIGVNKTEADDGQKEDVGIFVAGGLVGAISKYAGTDKNVDALDFANVTATRIESNKVSSLKITADFAEEAKALKDADKVLAAGAYRARALGATIGLINSQTSNFNISTNEVSKVTIEAHQVTFTYAFGEDGGRPRHIVTIGCGYQYTFGISYSFNTSASDVVDVNGYDKENAELVAYNNFVA